MSRPELTPGNGGGGKPTKPESENVWQFPWLIPQPPPEPIPDRPPLPIEPPPEPDPVTGPPAFETDPSPFLTQEITHYATPPSTKEEAERREKRKERAKNRWEKARKRASAAQTPAVIEEAPDFADLGLIDSEHLPASVAPDWPGSVPLSQGQNLHVDHLLSIEDDTMVREMLIGIKRDGIPPKAFVNDYLSQYAEWGWDDMSDSRTLQMLETVRNSDWDDLLAQADTELVETTAQDLADNTIEGLIVIDARTGLTLLNRTGVLGAGGSQYVGLQDYEVDAFAGLDLIFVHNHPNGSDASEADLRAAFAAGAEMLMVVTPKGYEYVYIRGRNSMVRVRAEEASYKVGPGTAAEHVLLEARSWEQARAYRDDSPEYVFRQEQTVPTIEVSGTVLVFSDQWSAQDQKDHFLEYEFPSTNRGNFRLLGRSLDDPFTVLIEQVNPILYSTYRYWINLKDPDTDYTIVGATIESIPTVYVQQSIIVDYTLDIELSGPPVWADRANRGVFSRDLNTRGRNEAFAVQSPVIGEDVRVEYVAREEMETFGLGNYVVISFPASVYQDDPSKMLRLGVDPNHEPDEWREDGRIFVAFAHLENINPKIEPGLRITDRDIAIIGTTGNTGLNDPDTKLPYKTEYENRHLDLVVVYYGSADESLEQAYSDVEHEANPITAFFGFAERSNLDGDPRLYGENLDPVLLWPEFDDLGRALDNKRMSVYRNIGHEE